MVPASACLPGSVSLLVCAATHCGWQPCVLSRAVCCPTPAVQGIFSAATYVQCNTQAALQEAARRCPGWPVLLTGHSLGGGVAALLTLLLQEAGLPEGLGPARCITTGTGGRPSRRSTGWLAGPGTGTVSGSSPRL